MTCRQYGQLRETVSEQWVWTDQHCVGSPSHGVVERWAEIAIGFGREDFDLLSYGRSRRLHVRDHGLTLGIARIDQDRDARVSMQELMQKLEPLCLKPKIHGADTGDVTAGSIETDDQASLNRIVTSREHNRNGRGRGFRRKSRSSAARCHDDSHRPAY